MTWFRIDDMAAFHEKIVRAGNEAMGACWRAGAWSSARLLNGFIPFEVAHVIAQKKVWAKLLDAGLLDPTDRPGYQIHDFLDWNPSDEEVVAQREKRREAGRLGGRHSAEVKRSKSQASTQANAKQVLEQVLKQTPSKPEAKLNPVPVPSRPVPGKERKRSQPASPPGVLPGLEASGAARDPGDHARVIDCYHREFLARRGAKPIIEGRNGKAAKRLLEVASVDRICSMIRHAFDDDWFGKQGAELWLIADSPNRYLPPADSEPRQRIEPPVSMSPEERMAAKSAAVDLERLAASRVVSG